MERYGIRFLVNSTNFGLVNTNLPCRMEFQRGSGKTLRSDMNYDVHGDKKHLEACVVCACSSSVAVITWNYRGSRKNAKFELLRWKKSLPVEDELPAIFQRILAATERLALSVRETEFPSGTAIFQVDENASSLARTV